MPKIDSCKPKTDPKLTETEFLYAELQACIIRNQDYILYFEKSRLNPKMTQPKPDSFVSV